MTEPPPSSHVLSADLIRRRMLRDFRLVWASRARRGPYQPRLSSAGKCVRALSYHRQGVPESNPMPARAGLRFEIGDLLHAYLDNKLRDLRYPLERREHRVEIRTPSGLVITGHFDRSLGGTTVLDFKSASDASFRLMADRDEPLPDYVAQVTGYLEACRQTPGLEQYTHALIVVVNKDSREWGPDGIDLWISRPIAHDPALAHAIIEKFETVERHAAEGTLPDRPYASPAEYPCRFCAWRDLCWGAALPTTATVPTDLTALRDEARAYDELGKRIRELENERTRLGGRLRAALADAGTRVGTTGAHDVKLVSKSRRILKEDLIPADTRERATVTVDVTELRVTAYAPTDPATPDGTPDDAPTEPPNGPGGPPTPTATPSGQRDGAGAPPQARGTRTTPIASADESTRFVRTGAGLYVTHDDFLAFVGRAAAKADPSRPDPLTWLRRHGFPTDLDQLTPAQVDRACAIAQRIIAPDLARYTRRAG